MFYIPNYLGHADNYIQANPPVTPTHIVPEWYFLPFYAILRAIPNKLLGVIALFGSIAVLAFLPWLDTSRVRSARYRPLYRQFFWMFVLVCDRARLSRLAAAGRRLRDRGAHPDGLLLRHFLIILPLLGLFETPKPLPNSISEAVLRLEREGLEALNAHRGIVLADGARRRRFRGRRRRLPPQEAAATPPQQTLVVRRPVRQLRSRRSCSAASRSTARSAQTCHGLQLLSFRNLADPGGPGFTEAQVDGARGRVQGQGRTERPGRDVRAPRPAGRPLPAAVAERASCPRRLAALPPDLSVLAKARSYERGFPWFVFDMLHAVPGAGRRLHRGAAQRLRGRRRRRACSCRRARMYNKYFPGHAHRDAAAAHATAASTTPTARRRRSTNMPRTSPPS